MYSNDLLSVKKKTIDNSMYKAESIKRKCELSQAALIAVNTA